MVYQKYETVQAQLLIVGRIWPDKLIVFSNPTGVKVVLITVADKPEQPNGTIYVEALIILSGTLFRTQAHVVCVLTGFHLFSTEATEMKRGGLSSLD